MTQHLTPEQKIDRILAANTERCAPEAARQIAEGQLTAKTWEQTVRMTRELVHATMRRTEDERRPRITPELEALHARALLEARRRQILRDGFKASIEQLALSTQCQEEKISS